MTSRCDFLVLGSGIAGLTFSIKLARTFPDKNIVIASKNSEESSTKYAQGGIAAVTDLTIDSFEQHIQDTLIAGDGLCDRSVVEMVVREGSECIRELESWGAVFDREPSGTLNLHREGGHQKHRVVHHKDTTGSEVQNTLSNQIKLLPNIELLTSHAAVDLIFEGNTCCGARLFDLETSNLYNVFSGSTLLATGGIGQVFSSTTNPNISTGDGIGMALRANVKTENLEFIQFHPTALYDERDKKGQVFLISEAVRGLGAKLVNHRGEHFMSDYDPRGDLAPRDIVSRAIASEMKRTGQEHVYLDCTEIDVAEFEAHFPEIKRKCLEKGIDPKYQPIPVLPAAHYLCGGIKTDTWGRTSMLNLFACGECACTGLHGANRLASNSLLEALVFANRCYLSVVNDPLFEDCKDHSSEVPFRISNQAVSSGELMDLTEEMQSIMSANIGVRCNQIELNKALIRLTQLSGTTEKIISEQGINRASLELRNMISVSLEIVRQSLLRNENRGTFFKEEE
ncbi:MAG TPA: L-aspartate oxidase [Flavobacteriales bacterium]|nr:L-aspartate oxidase [Flavobacteriales bacterium]